ncbi:hypothetical protein C5B85_01900 [Pseudoclavibacter sp. AY1F1]|uniref:hypothetical protein n=1 Tax=Pseudoclavibacter sp. AY1F1 TaxID=2080583 RepID=UPI000CE795D3|nr:hypothetical protein [Pseudoclavibacter sp. AY1F1]PPF47053.1 hypothetical protein C5B85_01900 [Pseudoclavibacter sp. AY1F1]
MSHGRGTNGPGHGGPARGGGTRPPFPPGHVVTLRSGHRSPRVYGELSQQLAAGLIEDRPDLATYPEAVAAWATAEAQASLLRRHLEEVGPIDPAKNEPRQASLAWLVKLERLAREHRTTLGLDPRSEAALAKDRAAASVLAVDLGQLAERGRAALDARQAAGIEPAPDLAGIALAGVIQAAPRFTTTPEPSAEESDNNGEEPTP